MYFSSQPYPEHIQSVALKTWFVAHFPLMFQQALVQMDHRNEVLPDNEDSLVRDIRIGWHEHGHF